MENKSNNSIGYSGTSVIALLGPGRPGNGKPSSRARGFALDINPPRAARESYIASSVRRRFVKIVPYTRPTTSHVTPSVMASELMPDKTASTTMIPDTGTTR